MTERVSTGNAAGGEEHRHLGGPGAPGAATGLTCPQCGDGLAEKAEGHGTRLECRSGHVVLLEALLEAQATAVQDALWAAVRALQEKAVLGRRMSQRAERQGDAVAAERFQRQAEAAERRADIVQDILIAAEH